MTIMGYHKYPKRKRESKKSRSRRRGAKREVYPGGESRDLRSNLAQEDWIKTKFKIKWIKRMVCML